MAQKASKQQAARNTQKLNRSHAVAVGVNVVYLVCKCVGRRRRSLGLYAACTAPALAMEVWLERVGRPRVVGGEVRRAGEDLEAKGLTEWMWDVTHWTWLCVAAVSLCGDAAWWLWAVVPLYSAYLACATYAEVRGAMGGLVGGGDGTAAADAPGHSKRQAKLERRGAQKVQQYR